MNHTAYAKVFQNIEMAPWIKLKFEYSFVNKKKEGLSGIW